MKKILFVVLILISAAVGVGGTLFWTQHNGKNSTRTAEKKTEELPTYNLPLEERTVNLADSPETHYLRTTVVIEIAGKGKLEELGKERLPQLMDRLIDILSREQYRTLETPEGKQQLKDRLSKGFDEELKEKGVIVRDVLFTDFVME